MKNAMIIFMLCLVSALFSNVSKLFSDVSKKSEEKVILLSKIEWQAAKNMVDTNGYCRIVGQDAVIVITNGLPNIDVIHWLPICREPEKKKKYEPVPYIEQGSW